MNKMRSLSMVMFVMLAASIALSGCSSAKTGPTIVDPTAKVQGLTYGEWVGKWWHYAIMLPAADNPLSGKIGNKCTFKREGNVGLLLANSTLSEPIECEVPSGMSLFIEVLGAECSTVEEAPFFGNNEAELHSCAQGFVPEDLKAEIDRIEIKNLSSYLAISPMVDFLLPKNNLLGVSGNTYGKSIGSGVYLMISPLSVGKHTIHLKGTYKSMEYTAEKTINLVVTK